ncbi:MAG: SEC-C domain-containing protein [Armatimonadetes bacterium]|nr:SEC-C domain-containing protein [Armatimonadota bacterium]
MDGISEIPKGAWQALTQQYASRVSVLRTEVNAGPAFDPQADPEPQVMKFRGIWDTGASSTAISPRVVQQLGLAYTGMRICHGANGSFNANTCLVSLLFRVPGNQVWIPQLTVSEAQLGDLDVLVGMDVIGIGDFAVTNYGGRTTLTFRIPSMERLDFTKQKPLHRDSGAPKRNAACPCGSGKKYKACCWPKYGG